MNQSKLLYKRSKDIFSWKSHKITHFHHRSTSQHIPMVIPLLAPHFRPGLRPQIRPKHRAKRCTSLCVLEEAQEILRMQSWKAGSFDRWYVSPKWMVHKGNSHSNGWFGGAPHIRKPPYVCILSKAVRLKRRTCGRTMGNPLGQGLRPVHGWNPHLW